MAHLSAIPRESTLRTIRNAYVPGHKERLSESQRAVLVEVGRALEATGYRFTAVSPRTHALVNLQAPTWAMTLRDVFGWNRMFRPNLLPPWMFRKLETEGLLRDVPGGFRSEVRFATIGPRLVAHSSFPTTRPDSVFLGPDTYRFAAQIGTLGHYARRALDVGAGTGIGGILVRNIADSVVMTDVNLTALDFARVNVELARVSDVELIASDGFRDVDGEFDLIIANPPFMKDDHGPKYRNGGGDFGEALSVEFVEGGLQRLAPGGTLLVYTGVAIIDGRDPFLQAIAPALERIPCRVDYEELDPDIFGEEVATANIHGMERIAAVSLKVTRRCN